MEFTLDSHSLLCICSKLNAPEILTTGATCSTLASLTRANSLWQPLLQQDFGLYVQATGSQGVDLQSTYRTLATATGSHALRFAAVYTDGGCDGMPDDLTYWADHAFQPNHYSPHCSDAKQDINIVAVLQTQGCKVDVQLSQHRQYLVERCAPAAALLFGPPGVAVAHPTQSIPQAAASLAGWSSLGLERLFVDLYQDLVLHQNQSTWGKLLLQDVPVTLVQEELQRLDAAAQRIEARQGRGLYNTVQQVPTEAVTAAANAARGAASGTGMFTAVQQHRGKLVARQQAPPNSSQAGSSIIAAAADAARQLAAATAAATAAAEGETAVAAELHAAVAPAGRALSSSAAFSSAGTGASATAAAATEEFSAKEAARHMYDSQQLQWFSEASSANMTALVREVVISRVGHFTCPLAAGAVLLGQHPAGAAAAAVTSQPTSASSSSSSSSPELQQVLAIKQDPLVATLDGMTSFDQVKSASAAGQLPPLLQREEAPGVEWVEFAALSAEQREARTKQGWYMRPVVWFRFFTPPRPDFPPPPEAQPSAANEEAVEADADMADSAAAGPAIVDESSQEAAQPASTAGDIEDSSADEETSPEFENQHDSSADQDMYEVDASEDEFTSPSGSNSSGSSIAADDPGADSDVGMGSDSEPGDGGVTGVDSEVDVEVFLDADAEMAEELIAVAQLEGAVDPIGELQVAAVQPPQVQAEAASQVQQQQQYRHVRTGSSGLEKHQQKLTFAVNSSSGVIRKSWLAAGTPALTVAAPPAGLQELLPAETSVPKHLLLRMPLQVVHSGNVAVLKLISSEDKMDEYDDPADEPNIDIQCISLRGVAVQVEADGVTLL